MPLAGEAKKLYQREYMKWRRSSDAPRVCQACGREGFIQAHHQDYKKPTEVLWLCSSCHKKLHLIEVGRQRTTSNPYINPLDKIARKQPKADSVFKQGTTICLYPELDADGNRIYEEG